MNHPINAARFNDDLEYFNERMNDIYNDSRSDDCNRCTVTFTGTLSDYKEALENLGLILEDFARRSMNEHWELKNGLNPKISGIFIVDIISHWSGDKKYNPEKKEYYIPN